MSRQSIIKGALILTTANIITRILGFFYRIYMANTIGSEGMGLYQLITPLYMLVWAISSSGFSTTMSKLTSQENARGRTGNVKRLLHISLVISVSTALVFSLIIYNFSEYIAHFIIKDIRTALSLRIISICFPFMAAGSLLRGYYLGLKNTLVSAVSQVMEQCVRMIIIYVLSSYFIPKGLEYACSAAVWGMAAGEIISFLYVFICFSLRKKVKAYPDISLKNAYILVLSMALPLTLNRMTGSLFSAVENLMIPVKLQKYGMSAPEALSFLGRLNGMAMPLITFPSSLITALATATMPAISENYALNNKSRIISTLHQSLTYTAVISAFTTGIFIFFPYDIGTLIYSESQTGDILKILALLCPFIYIQVTMSAVLNGLGQQVFIFKTGLISALINLGAVYFIIPLCGIKGYLYPWILNAIFITFVTIYKVSIILDYNIPFIKQHILPVIGITAACLISKLGANNIWHNIEFKYSVIISMLSVSALYIFFILSLGCIKKEDLKI